MTDAAFMEYASESDEDLMGWAEVGPEPLKSEADVEEILAKLANVRAKLGHVDHEHSLMVERYDWWKKRKREPLEAREKALLDAVTQWAFSKIDSNPRGPKSFDLPSGRVSTRAGQEAVEIEDEAAFIERYKDAGRDLVRFPDPPPPKPDKRLIKSGLLMGEVIEGAVLVQGERSVHVHTEYPPE